VEQFGMNGSNQFALVQVLGKERKIQVAKLGIKRKKTHLKALIK